MKFLSTFGGKKGAAGPYTPVVRAGNNRGPGGRFTGGNYIVDQSRMAGAARAYERYVRAGSPAGRMPGVRGPGGRGGRGAPAAPGRGPGGRTGGGFPGVGGSGGGGGARRRRTVPRAASGGGFPGRN